MQFLAEDGTLNCHDSCPRDPENDVDGDLVCGNVDRCPRDERNDADDDSLCFDDDPCPRDAG